MILCADWGSSVLRMRLVDPNTEAILSEVSSDRGVAVTNASLTGPRLLFYQNTLTQTIAALPTTLSLKGLPLVLSGMASSNIGMLELPYAPIPFRTDGSDLHIHSMDATKSFPHKVILVSGVRGPKDVMRGEEIQLVGCTPLGEARLYIFPGTHSKHIFVEGTQALRFTTFMTGEVFALLSQKSLLAGSVTPNSNDWIIPFRKGITDSLQGSLLQTAFWVRTNQLLQETAPEDNYHYLSGLVIGSELKELGTIQVPLTIVGSPAQRARYLVALDVLGIHDRIGEDASIATVKGQCRIYRR